ncbi:MAG: HipA domain-containing protein [Aquincola sp.]|nr:HipA domain-containing protein [Aquincola sp.]
MTEPTSALPKEGRRLNIFVNQTKVGTLHEHNDLWTLEYLPDWAESEHGFDLSPALPRSQRLHQDGATTRPVQWYFDNLLPEEKLRELMAADAQLRSGDDAFALLEYLGAESAGSLTLLPVDQVPPDSADLRRLAYGDLSQRIQALPRTTLTRQAPKRMSLAGAQHKMLAVLKGQDIYEPVGSTPSTHILKPDHPDQQTFPASAYLEWLTMTLAAGAQLKVPEVSLLRVPQPVYAIERFDRRVEASTLSPDTAATPPVVERLHVIDACQLLNKSRIFKYGVGPEVLHDISQACTNQLTTPITLFRWLVFNLLVGNDDCHLKNLSFLVSPGRIDPAPHYDMLATGAYHTQAIAEESGHWPAVRLAIRLSEEVTRFDQVSHEAVLAAAVAMGVHRSVAQRNARDVVMRTVGAFDALYARHYPNEAGLLEQLKAPTHQQRSAAPKRKGPVALDVREQQPGPQPSAEETAQQLKLLRVLRHIVLPEMARRILG